MIVICKLPVLFFELRLPEIRPIYLRVTDDRGAAKRSCFIRLLGFRGSSVVGESYHV